MPKFNVTAVTKEDEQYHEVVEAAEDGYPKVEHTAWRKDPMALSEPLDDVEVEVLEDVEFGRPRDRSQGRGRSRRAQEGEDERAAGHHRTPLEILALGVVLRVATDTFFTSPHP